MLMFIVLSDLLIKTELRRNGCHENKTGFVLFCFSSVFCFGLTLAEKELRGRSVVDGLRIKH